MEMWIKCLLNIDGGALVAAVQGEEGFGKHLPPGPQKTPSTLAEPEEAYSAVAGGLWLWCGTHRPAAHMSALIRKKSLWEPAEVKERLELEAVGPNSVLSRGSHGDRHHGSLIWHDSEAHLFEGRRWDVRRGVRSKEKVLKQWLYNDFAPATVKLQHNIDDQVVIKVTEGWPLTLKGRSNGSEGRKRFRRYWVKSIS